MLRPLRLPFEFLRVTPYTFFDTIGSWVAIKPPESEGEKIKRGVS